MFVVSDPLGQTPSPIPGRVGLRADDRSVLISERLGPREPNLRVWSEAARYFVFASIFTSLSGGLHGRACTSQRYVT